MKLVQYKGDRDCPDNYDNFTLDKIYTYQTTSDYDNTGLILVTDDTGVCKGHPGIDFDFLN